MGSRLELHEELKAILGSNNVYFQSPASKQMSYPCIRYSLDAPNQNRADNRIYKNTNRYEITVIDYSPESVIPDSIQQHFQMCSIDRRYVADNLNHTILTLYY